MNKPYEKETYFALTLDPVHIGTGGYRLGRVDNTITREPGTNLPKIPGTGISGVTRAFTAMAIQNTVDMKNLVEEKDGVLVLNMEIYEKMKYQRPVYQFDENKHIVVHDGKPAIKLDNKGKERYNSCAGKGGEKGDGHCGEPDCEVCVAYGFSKDGNSFQGMAQFFDARILFFPVYSMLGPVWITSPAILKEFKEAMAMEQQNKQVAEEEKKIKININVHLDDDEQIRTDLRNASESLNLGWVMLKNQEKAKPVTIENLLIPSEIVDRAVLISDKLFSRIVNDNLEVRTSVAIDPATGAAVDGALYTYEAIPRATVLWFDVVYNKPENFRINGQDIMMEDATTKTKAKAKANWEWIKENVEKGLKLIEYMGVGGMNTRGMGRMRILNLKGLENE